MKITTLTIFLISLFASCDEIDELTEFNANFTLQESVFIDVSESDDETQSFAESLTLNLAENEDVSDNLSAVEAVEIASFSYMFTNVSGNVEVQITNALFSVGGATIQIDPVNPSEVMGQEFVVQNTASLNALAAALQANPQTTIAFQGSVNGSPVSFTVDVEVEVAVTIDPL